jgi:hypothetical protein
LSEELEARLRSAKEALDQMRASKGSRKDLEVHFSAYLSVMRGMIGRVTDEMIRAGRRKDVFDSWKNAVMPWVRREFNPDAYFKLSCFVRIRNKKQNQPPIIPDDEETLSHFSKRYWDRLYLLDEIWPNFKKCTVTDPIEDLSYDLFDLCKTVTEVGEKLIADCRTI